MDYGAEAVERARAFGDPGALATATMLHGAVISDFFQHRVRSAPLLRESVDSVRRGRRRLEPGDGCDVPRRLEAGRSTISTGAPDGLHDAARRFEALDNPWGRSYALRHLADVLVVRGHYDEAAAALHDAVVGLRAVGGIGVTSSLAARLGYISALMGRADDAERWLDEALDARSDSGTSRTSR